MTREFDDLHVEALRAADRPRRLDQDSRRRIADRMFSVYDDRSDSTTIGTGRSELIVLEAEPADRRVERRVSPRWVVAAAAAVLAVVGLWVGLVGRGDDATVDVAVSDLDPELALVVREWCGDGLVELAAALRKAQDDAGPWQATLVALEQAADEYLWLLLESGIRDGSERTNEVGRFRGEVALTRDGVEPASEQAVVALVRRFADELAITSSRSAECEIPT